MKMKSLLCFVLAAAFLTGCAAPQNDDFRGMYDETYNRNDINDWELENGVLYDFEKDRNLFQTMSVENFEGTIGYNDDAAFISSGEASMKSSITLSTINAPATVKYKFKTGKNGKDVTHLKEIALDVFNPNAFKLKIKPVITSAFASYYFDETEVAENAMSTVIIKLEKATKDYLGEMAGFELDNVLELEYRLTIPAGALGEKVVYFDNLRYVGGDESYTPPAAPQPFTREPGEVNNFNDVNRCRFVTPEYEIGLAGFDNQNQFVSAEYSEEIKHEGAGSLKFTVKGLDLGEYDAGTYGYPALSLRREDQIGANNLAKYNTLSFWIYYDARSGSGGLSKNPDSVKFVFEFRNNYYPNGPEIVPDLVIPKHCWVNIKINLDDAAFGLRDYTTALRFWTYGFNTSQMDRIIYFDDIELSEEHIPSSELNGKKYAMYIEKE